MPINRSESETYTIKVCNAVLDFVILQTAIQIIKVIFPGSRIPNLGVHYFSDHNPFLVPKYTCKGYFPALMNPSFMAYSRLL
jgi:hypothetical protein